MVPTNCYSVHHNPCNMQRYNYVFALGITQTISLYRAIGHQIYTHILLFEAPVVRYKEWPQLPMLLQTVHTTFRRR